MATDLARLRAAVDDLRTRRADAWGRVSSPVRGPRCPSGLAVLDAALNGGFARGNIHEFVTSPTLARSDGAAVHTVALLTATRAAGRQGWILYIDTTGDFYPPAAGRMGVPLERLIVVRAKQEFDALWTCEQALRCRGLAAVVAVLPRIDTQASRRLQLAAEAGGGLGLLLRSESHAPDTGSGAQSQIGRQAQRVLAFPTFAFTRIRFDPLVGDTEARRLLITVLKLREGRPPEPFVLELSDDGWGTPSAWMPDAKRSFAVPGTGAERSFVVPGFVVSGLRSRIAPLSVPVSAVPGAA